jgi:hypothetical protein
MKYRVIISSHRIQPTYFAFKQIFCHDLSFCHDQVIRRCYVLLHQSLTCQTCARADKSVHDLDCGHWSFILQALLFAVCFCLCNPHATFLFKEANCNALKTTDLVLILQKGRQEAEEAAATARGAAKQAELRALVAEDARRVAQEEVLSCLLSCLCLVLLPSAWACTHAHNPVACQPPDLPGPFYHRAFLQVFKSFVFPLQFEWQSP